MKTLILTFTLSLTGLLHAEVMEKHFSGATEKKCSKEVLGLDCGTPTEKNADAFIACVDQRLESLSSECQEFHLNVRSQRKSHKH